MEAYIGTIMQFPWNWGINGWALCDGRLLSISQYSALFSLLGTNFGGDGRTTFALPDLRPKDANGDVLNLNIGELYNGVPYLAYHIALVGIYPARD